MAPTLIEGGSRKFRGSTVSVIVRAFVLNDGIVSD